MENQTQPTIFVTVPMPETLEMRLRLRAASLRVSRAELARVAIADWLDRTEVIDCPECNSVTIAHIGGDNYRCEDCGHHFGR